MTIDLYYFKPSVPCRSVMLTAEAIGLPLNLITVDLFKGEHLTSEFEEVFCFYYQEIGFKKKKKLQLKNC